MDKLFISAVTREFGSTRRLIEPIVRRLGYEPVSMDNWTTAEGELIDWLRRQIDDCAGVIHLSGLAYGAEPPTCDRDAHGFAANTVIPERYSYTQFELLYARQAGKKTWIIEPGPSCQRDNAPEQIDYDDSLTHDEAVRQQGIKTELQAKYRELLREHNLVRHLPNDDKDIQLLIHALRDLPEEYQKRFSTWQNAVTDRLEALHKRQQRIYSLSFATLILAIASVAGLLLLFKDNRESQETANQRHEEITSGNERLSENQNQLAEKMAEMQATLAEMSKDQQPGSAPLSAWPRPQLESELARRMGMSVEELEALIATAKESIDSLIQAQAFLASGDAEKAEEKFDQVIAAEQEAEKRLVEAYLGKGQIAFGKGRYPQAQTFFQSAFDRSDKSSTPRFWEESIDWLSITLHRNADFLVSEELQKELLDFKIKRYGANTPNVATSLNNLALLLLETNRIQDAEPLMRRALVILASFTPRTNHIHPNLKTAILSYWDMFEKYDHQEGTPRERLISVGTEAGWEEDYWRSTVLAFLETQTKTKSSEALALFLSGEYAEAETLWREELTRLNENEATNLETIWTTKMNIAAAEISQEKYAPAKENLETLLGIQEFSDSRNTLVARSAHHLARAYIGLDDIEKAEESHSRAIKIYDALPEDQVNTAQYEQSRTLLETLRVSSTAN